MLSSRDLLSPEELNNFATDYLGLNPTDSDLFYESYYEMDTESNFYEEELARCEGLFNY